MLCTTSIDMTHPPSNTPSNFPSELHIQTPKKCKSKPNKLKSFFYRLFHPRIRSYSSSNRSHSHLSEKSFSTHSHTLVNTTHSLPVFTPCSSSSWRIASALSLASALSHKKSPHQQTLSQSSLDRRIEFIHRLTIHEEALLEQESKHTLDCATLHRRSMAIKERIQSATSSIMELSRDEFAHVVQEAGFTIVNDEDECMTTCYKPIYHCMDIYEPPPGWKRQEEERKELLDDGPGLLQSDTITSTKQGRFTVTRYPSIKKQKEKKVFKLVQHSDPPVSSATWSNVDIASLLLSPSGQSVYGPMNRSSLYDLWNIVAQKADANELEPPSKTPPLSEPSLSNDSSSQESLDRSGKSSSLDSMLHLDPQEASELEALASLSLGLEAHMMDPLAYSSASLLSVKKTKTGRMFTLERKKQVETSIEPVDSAHRKGRFTVN